MKKLLIAAIVVLAVSAAPARAQKIATPPSASHADTASAPFLISSIRVQGPLDFCGEPVPLGEPDVRERLEKELLTTIWNRPQTILWLKRAGRHVPYIEEELRRNEMPSDLKYMAIIESALLPHIGSNRGARGFWQFIDPTAARFGMVVNSEIDERRSLPHSTRAAIAYLKSLYADLKSWTLAAAAYNMGEEGLKAEILVQNTNDYYRLYLPLETQQYVFRAIAAKMVHTNPRAYGFTLNGDDLYRPVDTEAVEVKATKDTPIFLIAQAANTSFKGIKDLNPEIRGYYLVEGTRTILVPRGSAAGFQQRLEKLMEQWLAERWNFVYTVKKGDTLSGIAQRFDVPLPALMIWNRTDRKRPLQPGEKLFIFAESARTDGNGGTR
ncbi:MAG: Membrane-bound lytic murein transglycosylase D precursor [Syntrophaceae bacterium PtaU1.Bin231]|nr:MAG: Membrane-bound lytic murein transglycosylase D precursor [Syntrophaceae bacterium PtaU1.Bin231]